MCELSLVAERRGYSLVVDRGFSLQWALLLAEHGLNGCRTWAYLPHDMWNLPGSGIEPMSTALAGRFYTMGPPEKSITCCFCSPFHRGCSYPGPGLILCHLVDCRIPYHGKAGASTWTLALEGPTQDTSLPLLIAPQSHEQVPTQSL